MKGPRIGLLDWVGDPVTDRAVHFAHDDGSWEHWPYPELARICGGVASRLLDACPSPAGRVVSIVVPTGPLFLGAYFGTLLAGATPAPLVPPMLFEDIDAYVQHTSALLRVAGGLIVTTDALSEIVGRAAHRAGLDPPLALCDQEREERAIRRPSPELALLQFTSGSSGRPRGVRVTRENLESNIAMIRNWIDWGPDDVGAHWLPLYHDMGLIGCTLAPVIHQRDLWILRPDQFIRDPQRWLDCFGRGPAHFTASPGFGFAYAHRRATHEGLEGSDFSAWRVAILGAERLDPGTLGRFALAMAPHGFRAQTFLPAYGLAECTLAVTGGEVGRMPHAVLPDWSSMRDGAPVSIRQEAEVSAPEIGDGAGWILGCGTALSPTKVEIRDEHGTPLPDGSLGEIHVHGPTVADGYEGDERSASTEFVAGGVRTGDAAFVWNNELFVVGRLGDAIKIRGRTVYAEDLEAKLASIPAVPRGRTVVVPGLDHGKESVTVITETEPGTWVDAAVQLLRAETGSTTLIRIATGPPGTIPRTSSGKPRRKVLWQALVDGTLPVAAVEAR